ncbi:FxLYD domain-containing protein [Pedosphaera parvula]|uniref:Uncharacterized protein n=1 Tax=Pedosphaera parvula (strain Ellin514) TaxID=320771 RepID=B9XB37_PEDPL|nr:FxLYD domain-containing protein [Pedosphaera parvula]EEF62722.1 hypothetical protein Cflav_PD5357 [Pedosphaera parvula Ellin514]
MSDAKYLKGSCQHCDNHIEFPAEAAGSVVDCPHCGNHVRLVAPATPITKSDTPVSPDLAPRKSSRLIALSGILGALIFLVVLVIGWFMWKHRQTTTTPVAPAVVATGSNEASSTATVPGPETNAISNPTVINKKAKSISDLTVGEIKLEKTKGSSLVYATGTLKNDSDYQRFGVRLELDILNANGKNLGTAQDYITVIEPRHDWQFRALVVDSKATSAKVHSIKEEE